MPSAERWTAQGSRRGPRLPVAIQHTPKQTVALWLGPGEANSGQRLLLVAVLVRSNISHRR